ncbi:MAG: hypothetical protein JSU74_05350 [Candidatus Zixiibacteriota bacterium]|nr:MAG: hypothetical protein JSU74_05350 [candidate division Zixibacteria bacterium]
MITPESIKEIEKRAYRATFDDGLYDILFGVAFLILAWISTLDSIGVPRLYGYLSVIILPLIPLLGKKYISTPRLGAVEFGPRRKSKKLFLLVIIGAVIFLQMPVIMIAGAGGFFEVLGGSLSVPVMVGMIIAPLLLLAAYFIDYPRMYIYAVLLLVSIPHAAFMYEFVGVPFNGLISFGIPGLVILIYGLNLLAKFIRKYPLPTPEANHAG